MVSKKKIVIAAITAVALSVGVAGTATAHNKGPKTAASSAAHDAQHAALEALVAKTIGLDAAVIKTRLAAGETLGAIAGSKKAALIDVLVAEETKRIDAAVTAGKLTAAQATTLKAGLVAHVTAEVDSVRGPKGGFGKGGPKTAADIAAHEAERAALEALVAKTIGLDAAVIKTRLAAGETLGAIAGSKKAALIDVLVAEETKRIDAAVTAGKLTAAQATTLKAGLVAHVTAEVDSVRGPKGGAGFDGPGKGHKGGHGPKGGMTPPAAGTTTGTTASYKA